MSREILRAHGWLSYQSRGIQDALLASGREQSFSPGTTIFSVGDPPGGCFALIRGQLTISIAPNSRGPSLAHVATPGAWYGEGAYLTRGERRVGLHVVIESRLFHVPLEAMDRLTAHDPEWMRRFGTILINNFHIALQALDDLLIEDASRRIAAVLARCLGSGAGRTLVLSQHELGLMSNASRKVVNQTLRSFAENGWLRPGYGRLEVLDMVSLHRYAHDA